MADDDELLGDVDVIIFVNLGYVSWNWKGLKKGKRTEDSTKGCSS